MYAYPSDQLFSSVLLTRKRVVLKSSERELSIKFVVMTVFLNFPFRYFRLFKWFYWSCDSNSDSHSCYYGFLHLGSHQGGRSDSAAKARLNEEIEGAFQVMNSCHVVTILIIIYKPCETVVKDL